MVAPPSDRNRWLAFRGTLSFARNSPHRVQRCGWIVCAKESEAAGVNDTSQGMRNEGRRAQRKVGATGSEAEKLQGMRPASDNVSSYGTQGLCALYSLKSSTKVGEAVVVGTPDVTPEEGISDMAYVAATTLLYAWFGTGMRPFIQPVDTWRCTAVEVILRKTRSFW